MCNFNSKDVSTPVIFPLAACALFNFPVFFVRKTRVNPSLKFWRNFNILVRLRSYEICVVWEVFLFVYEIFQSPLFDFIVRIPVCAVIKITRITFFLYGLPFFIVARYVYLRDWVATLSRLQCPEVAAETCGRWGDVTCIARNFEDCIAFCMNH